MWSFSEQKANMWTMMHNINLPKEHLNLKGLHALVLLVSNKARHLHDLRNSEYEELLYYGREI